jgi:GcrA cell cycle regulator
MTAGTNIEWPAERTEHLRRLWAEGGSASEIGRELLVSRNAVLGKAHRLGLAGRSTESRKPRRKRNLEEDRARSRRYYREVTKPKLAAKLRDHKKGGFYRRAGGPQPACVPSEPPPAPDMRVIPLTELTPFVCHFPIGDPRQSGFGFCGAPKEATGPYCKYHHRIAYHAISDRRQSLEGLAKVAA